MTKYSPKGQYKAYTVEELIKTLQELAPNLQIKITDPDTGWTCPTMLLWVDVNNTLWIDPCDYPEMIP